MDGENTQEINLNEFYLDPKKMVEVPIDVWSAIINVVKQVEQSNRKQETKDVYTWFDRKTHKAISASSQKKLSQEKLNEKYYKNLDLEKTKANVVVTRDELGLSLVCLELLGAFDHIFKMNVEKGNRIPIPVKEAPMTVAP